MNSPPEYAWLRAAAVAAGATFTVCVALLWGLVPPDVRWEVMVLMFIVSAGAGWWAAVDARRRAEKAERWEKGLCLGCGYDIRRSEGRCPECGRPIRFRTGQGRQR